MFKPNAARIARAQELMRDQGMIALMIMNHDDYRYFFGEIRVQPRAIIPASGPPVVIGFKGEEEELRGQAGDFPLRVFSHVGEQISNVRETFRSLFDGPPPGLEHPEDGGRPKVGMQMWFHTPAFLVDMFRSLNPQVELVPSDPVMDEMRMVKEPEEVDLMRKAQAVAALGMDRARALLRPGVTGHEIATEVLYAMMKAGAEGTSTPIHVNAGARSCWIHGLVDDTPIKEGDLVVIDLTPQVEGYCANLARTFVLGKPTDRQRALLETYREIHEATRKAMLPGTKTIRLDRVGKEISVRRGLDEYRVDGICHGIGLRFEETPASTIIPTHRAVAIREGMTMTVGHTVLAVPGVGGVRFEDVCLVTSQGGKILHPYPIEWEIPLG